MPPRRRGGGPPNLGFFLLVTGLFFLLLRSRTTTYAEIALSRNWRQEHCIGNSELTHMVVAVASDAPGLLPIMAAVNSTYSNAKEPERVSFVVITRHVRRLKSLMDTFLSNVATKTTICGGFSDLLMQRPALLKLTSLRNSTRIKRKELLSPFNFAAFYLPYVLRESRAVLYLDTDTVVKGDVGELEGLNLHDAPAAAVEDCSQKIFKYVNFDMLMSKYDDKSSRSGTSGAKSAKTTQGGEADPREEEEEPLSLTSSPQLTTPSWTRWGVLVDGISNETCVFNRGVVLFDNKRWRELRLTETIEDLVDAFVESKARLWRGGISQPPFLLTLAGRYHKLDLEWNVRGLGRMDLGRKEWLAMAQYAKDRYHTDTRVFERHMAPSGPFRQTFNPFLCPYAAFAKILHFNGEFKPWMMDGRDTEGWRLLGINVTVSRERKKTLSRGPREIAGTCRIESCPTAVNVSTGRRLRSACEAWYLMLDEDSRPKRVRWDQQRYRPDNRPWDPKPETVTEYYATGCIARPPLCTCLSELSDECVTTCASHWHEYVSEDLMNAPASFAHVLTTTPATMLSSSSHQGHDRSRLGGGGEVLGGPIGGGGEGGPEDGAAGANASAHATLGEEPRKLWYEDYQPRRQRRKTTG